jgi:uncharacterized protein YacL
MKIFLLKILVGLLIVSTVIGAMMALFVGAIWLYVHAEELEWLKPIARGIVCSIAVLYFSYLFGDVIVRHHPRFQKLFKTKTPEDEKTD